MSDVGPLYDPSSAAIPLGGTVRGHLGRRRMNAEVKPKTAGLIRVGRHPAVLAVAKCAAMCVLGADSWRRRTMTHDAKCCD